MLPPPSTLAGLPTITIMAGRPPPLVFGPDTGALTMSSNTSNLGSGTVVQPSTVAGVSASLLNLLLMSASRALPLTLGVYVREGLPPVPPKLAAKILRWEFVDMTEMLPEYWSSAKAEEEDQK